MLSKKTALRGIIEGKFSENFIFRNYHKHLFSMMFCKNKSETTYMPILIYI